MRICAHQLGHQAALPHVTIGPDCTRVGQGFLMTTRCLPPAQFGRRHRLPGGKWLCVSGGTPRQSPHPDPRARLKASLPTTMTTLEGDRLLQHAAQLRTVCKKVPPPTSSSVGFPSKRRCHCGGGGGSTPGREQFVVRQPGQGWQLAVGRFQLAFFSTCLLFLDLQSLSHYRL